MSREELWKQLHRQQRLRKQAEEDLENEEVTLQEIEELLARGRERLSNLKERP